MVGRVSVNVLTLQPDRKESVVAPERSIFVGSDVRGSSKEYTPAARILEQPDRRLLLPRLGLGEDDEFVLIGDRFDLDDIVDRPYGDPIRPDFGKRGTPRSILKEIRIVHIKPGGLRPRLAGRCEADSPFKTGRSGPQSQVGRCRACLVSQVRVQEMDGAKSVDQPIQALDQHFALHL